MMEMMEVLMALRGASALIAIGGALALFAAGVSLLGAIKNNQEQQDLILGARDTFCQLLVYADDPDLSLGTHHRGSGNIYDVQVVFREVKENGTPIYNRERRLIGTLTSETWPWPLEPLGMPGPIFSTTPRYFEAQITQRNGTSFQELVIYPKENGDVDVGFLRLEFNKKSYEPQFDRLPPRARGITVSAAEIDRIMELRRERGLDR